MGAFEFPRTVALALVAHPVSGLSINPLNRTSTFRHGHDFVYFKAHRVAGRQLIVDGFAAQGAGSTVGLMACPDLAARSPVTVTGVSYWLQQDSG